MKKILLSLLTLTTLMISRDHYSQDYNQRNYDKYDSYNNSYNQNYRVLMRLRDFDARNFLLDNQQNINIFWYKNYCMPINESKYSFIERMFQNTQYTTLELLQDLNTQDQFIKVTNENGKEGFIFENSEICKNIM